MLHVTYDVICIAQYHFLKFKMAAMYFALYQNFKLFLVNLYWKTLKTEQNVIVNPRSLEGGGIQIDPTPSTFLALNFCSLTDCQKLWHNCSLFVNTSFGTNLTSEVFVKTQNFDSNDVIMT